MATVRSAWMYEPGEQFSLQRDGRILCTYHFRTDHRKPYLHPVLTADAQALTAFEPYDCPWHRGVWFAWKLLNGVSYWEESEGRADGVVQLIGREEVSFDGSTALVRTSLQYRPRQGNISLDEKRSVCLHLPEEDGTYVVDWRLTFTARHGDVSIDRTPPSRQGPWAGCAGLAVRLAHTLGNYRVIDSEGRSNGDTNSLRARWVDFSGDCDGGHGLTAGLAIFDHPSNLRHPTTWRCNVQPGAGFLNPTPVFHEPYILLDGRSLELRYRMLVHSGLGDAQKLAHAFEAFAST